jgi:hypothetical protein
MAENFKVVKDFKDGPFFHYADPKETNRALCGASTVRIDAIAPPEWGSKQELVQEEYCAKCAAIAKKGPAKAARKATKKATKKRKA